MAGSRARGRGVLLRGAALLAVAALGGAFGWAGCASASGGGTCAASGCAAGGGGGEGGVRGADGGPPPHVLRTIAVRPSNPIDFIDNGVPVTQTFTAIGLYADGTTADLTSRTTFTAADPTLGSFSAGTGSNVFTSTTKGGFTTIDAAVNGLRGHTIVTLVPRRLDPSGAPLDFFFVTPYRGAPMPASMTLDFGTKIQQADLGFVIDSTGSMGGKIANLQGSLASLAASVRAAVPSVAMGVADFRSWPCAPDGGAGDYPWRLDNRIITVATGAGLGQIQSAINALSASGGGDGPEPDFDALYFAATGAGGSDCGGGTVPAFNPTTAPGGAAGEATGALGGMGFRAGALPVVVVASDAESHDAADPNDAGTFFVPGFYGAPYAHGHDQTLAALKALGAKVIGIASTCGSPDVFSPIFTGDTVADCSYEPYAQFRWLAEQTGTVVPPAAFAGACGAGMCCTGTAGAGEPPDAAGSCPLVFHVDQLGNGLGTAVTSAIVSLVSFGTLDVSTKVVGTAQDQNGNPLPAGHTTADFLLPAGATKGVSPLDSTPAVGAPGGPAAIDPASGRFLGVRPGATVRFAVKAYDDFVPQLTSGPQLFKATIAVMGDGVTLLDHRDVYILVPPADLLN